MKKVVRRKLFLFGRYSLALLPPKKWLTKLGVEEGDSVEIEMNASKNRMIIHFHPENKTQTTPDKDKPTSKKPDKPNDGWEPIPQL